MSALLYLARLKTFGMVRSWFRRPVSAILTILAVFLFLAFFITLSMNMGNEVDTFSFVILGAGSAVVITLFLVFMLFAKNRALVFLNDASFVLAGPFSRKEVLAYVLLNDLIQNIWVTLGFSMYILIFFQSAMGNAENMIVYIFLIFITFLFAIILSSYIYVLEASYANVKRWKQIIAIAIAIIYLGIVYSQVYTRTISFELVEYLVYNEVIWQLPIIGWLIQAFVGFAHGNMSQFGMSVLYLLLINGVTALLFFTFKGDFYEKSIMDAERIGEIVSKAKSGNETEVAMMNSKVKNRSGKFRTGYLALWSRYWLQARKTGQFLKINDITFFIMYTAIARMSNSIISYQVLLSMVVFISINPESMVYELKRPYIFLIPEDNFKKLLMVTLPLLQRTLFIMIMGGIAMVLLFNQTIVQALIITLSLLGIGLILIAGSVWTLYLIKSKQNPLVEQLLRMVVILMSSIPAIVIITIMTIVAVPFDSPYWQPMYSITLVLSNFFVGGFIIYSCRNMLQGHDLFV